MSPDSTIAGTAAPSDPGIGFGIALADRVRPRARTIRRSTVGAAPGRLAGRLVDFASAVAVAPLARLDMEQATLSSPGSEPVRPPLDPWLWGDDETPAEHVASTPWQPRRSTARPAPRRGLPLTTRRGTRTLGGAGTAPGAIARRMTPGADTTPADPVELLARSRGRSARAERDTAPAVRRAPARPSQAAPAAPASSALPEDLQRLQRMLIRDGKFTPPTPGALGTPPGATPPAGTAPGRAATPTTTPPVAQTEPRVSAAGGIDRATVAAAQRARSSPERTVRRSPQPGQHASTASTASTGDPDAEPGAGRAATADPRPPTMWTGPIEPTAPARSSAPGVVDRAALAEVMRRRNPGQRAPRPAVSPAPAPGHAVPHASAVPGGPRADAGVVRRSPVADAVAARQPAASPVSRAASPASPAPRSTRDAPAFGVTDGAIARRADPAVDHIVDHPVDHAVGRSVEPPLAETRAETTTATVVLERTDDTRVAVPAVDATALTVAPPPLAPADAERSDRSAPTTAAPPAPGQPVARATRAAPRPEGVPDVARPPASPTVQRSTAPGASPDPTPSPVAPSARDAVRAPAGPDARPASAPVSPGSPVSPVPGDVARANPPTVAPPPLAPADVARTTNAPDARPSPPRAPETNRAGDPSRPVVRRLAEVGPSIAEIRAARSASAERAASELGGASAPADIVTAGGADAGVVPGRADATPSPTPVGPVDELPVRPVVAPPQPVAADGAATVVRRTPAEVPSPPNARPLASPAALTAADVRRIAARIETPRTSPARRADPLVRRSALEALTAARADAPGTPGTPLTRGTPALDTVARASRPDRSGVPVTADLSVRMAPGPTGLPGTTSPAAATARTAGATGAEPGRVTLGLLRRSVADVPRPPRHEPLSIALAATGASTTSGADDGLIGSLAQEPARDVPIADRFMSELSRRRAPRAVPLPERLRPLSDVITGGASARIATDTVSRQALRSVGKVAATVGDTIHLDRPVHQVSTEVLAHELTHVAHPSPAPRFFDDARPSMEERRAEAVGKLMRSAAPSVIRRAPSDDRPASSSSGAVSASALADQLTNAGTGGDTTIRRWKSGTVGGRGSGPTMGGGRPAPAPAPSVVAPAPVMETPVMEEDTSVRANVSARDLVSQFDRILELLEERVLRELERRGGRLRGGF